MDEPSRQNKSYAGNVINKLEVNTHTQAIIPLKYLRDTIFLVLWVKLFQTEIIRHRLLTKDTCVPETRGLPCGSGNQVRQTEIGVSVVVVADAEHFDPGVSGLFLTQQRSTGVCLEIIT